MALWQSIHINSQSYIYKVKESGSTEENPGLQCFFSDFTNIWTESVVRGQIIERLEDRNPYLDIEYEIFVTNIEAPPATKSDKTNIQVEQVDDGAIKLDLTYFIQNNSTKFHWILKPCSSQTVFEELTQPLLQHIVKLENEANALRKVIESKDIEIKQYELENRGPLMRRTVVTEPFDPLQYRTPAFFDCPLASLKLWPSAGTSDDAQTATTENGKNLVEPKTKIPSSKGRREKQNPNRLVHKKPAKLNYNDSQESECDDDGLLAPAAVARNNEAATEENSPKSANKSSSKQSETVVQPRKIPRLNL